MLFVFNFHPTNSYNDFIIGVDWLGKHEYVFCTDDEKYGGFKRIDTNSIQSSFGEGFLKTNHRIKLFLPSRCAFVLKLIEEK